MGNSGGSGGTTSPLTTKGDVWGYSTVNARVPVGSDAQVLTADSTQTLGVKWAATAAVATNNESQAGVLVNATTAGDAGGRADDFTGSVLNAKWTQRTGTPTNTVKSSVLSIHGLGELTQPFTPSGATRIEARVSSMANAIGICVFDSSGQTGNGVMLYVNSGTALTLYKLASGSFSAQGTGPTYFNNLGPWIWVRLDCNAATGSYTAYNSVDRVTWSQFATFGGGFTFTPALLDLRTDNAAGFVSCDVIDVVS